MKNPSHRNYVFKHFEYDRFGRSLLYVMSLILFVLSVVIFYQMIEKKYYQVEVILILIGLCMLLILFVHLITYRVYVDQKTMKFKSFFINQTYSLLLFQSSIKYTRTLRGARITLFLKEGVDRRKRINVLFASQAFCDYLIQKGFKIKK
ncbi:hypothetical protein BN85310870 [Paracholeplasma brassicae]|uniref:Uncharacterized protein n=1 Tax=Acholeplasma brassicae TaxID=61635 RepID=U4KRW0_9MOLU|nr:hypothetical protein [Paracholeplasma brassicae]CCV66108.1 hypothetical protein BN85310870 [Paracholeplasma brassicae]